MSRVPHDYRQRYEAMLKAGVAPKLADMLASRQGPAVSTDATFMQGRLHDDQFHGDEQARRHYESMARAAGVSTSGKFYMSQMAEYPGDPKAWIDSKGDVKRFCEENGFACNGTVKVKAPTYKEVPDDQPYMVADDIVESSYAERVAANPDMAHASAEKVAETKHELRESLSGR